MTNFTIFREISSWRMLKWSRQLELALLQEFIYADLKHISIGKRGSFKYAKLKRFFAFWKRKKRWNHVVVFISSSQISMVFFYQNFSDLLWEKIVLMIEKKHLKFEAEGREFAKCLRSLEQFIQTVQWKVKTNFETECFFNLFLEVSQI